MSGPVDKRTVIFLLAFLVIASMGIFHHFSLRYGTPSLFGTGPSLEQIKRDIIPPTRMKNEERKSMVRQVCNRHRNQIPRLSKEDFAFFSKFIIVDLKRRIMYCPVPKAACTTWKAVFLELRGVTNIIDVHAQERESVFHLSDLSENEIQMVLRNFTKFMVVRHPFTRILSAYRNKLEPGGSFESTHKNDTKYYWRDKLASHILKIYRGRKTMKRYKEHRDEYDLTFREFSEFLSDHPDHAGAKNRHWKEFHSICYPCDIEYDYIAKVETLVNDSLLFLVGNGLSTHVTRYAGHATHSSSSSAVAEFYNDLPIETIEKLYRRYEMDFRLFGYDPKLLDGST